MFDDQLSRFGTQLCRGMTRGRVGINGVFKHISLGSYMMKITTLLVLLSIPLAVSAQTDSTRSSLSFDADFRFRVEQDWHSRKSDGSYRDDRTRLRYRLRAGVTHKGKWYQAGFRIRTGYLQKQQDPQLTLGDGFKEFGTLPIGLEKLYFQGELKSFTFWLGKNTFPFEKNNELFWSDNVYPDGVSIVKSFRIDSGILDQLELKGGHFVMNTSGKSLSNDTYFQGYQLHASFFNKRFKLFPSFYLFKNMPDIPDGAETFKLDYSILHAGNGLSLMQNELLKIEFDYYYNLQDYDQNDSISTAFKEQKSGFALGLKYGKLKRKKDWKFSATYTRLQKFAAVDIFAQNDWARWDYSSYGSPDGRLTNLKGVEVVAAYMIDDKAKLTMKYYLVEQLIPVGVAKETGSRIRFDLDVKF